jgi:glucose-1-phosphate cytidylyltransferase
MGFMPNIKPQVVILCGGKGTRMGNGDLPKALFPIGDKPILWHLMNIYAHFGYQDFILCVGHKGQKIKEYFAKEKKWRINFVETGLHTNTGGRINRIKKHLKSDVFFATYADGLADIDLKSLLSYHLAHKKTATLTAVKPYSPFGVVGINNRDAVTHFEEKPILDHWINGGFFIFSREIFSYIDDNDILERDTFGKIVKDNSLMAYKHHGFWECMDTYKDNLRLNELWSRGRAPWALWKKGFKNE